MNLSNLIEKLLIDEKKVTALKIKRVKARENMIISMQEQQKAQNVLDQINCRYRHRIKNFQSLDAILAELNFIKKQKAQQKAQNKAKQKNAKQKNAKQKSAKQLLADIMDCLKTLPEAQQAAVIEAMENKQKQNAN